MGAATAAPRILDHPQATIRVDEIGGDRRRIRVSLHDRNQFSPRLEWITRYPLDLVATVLKVKNPAYLCDEIARDEDPEYVQADLDAAIFSYLSRDAMDGRRVLDFGCGAGSSTAILGRLLPRAEIIGVELEAGAIEVARARAAHHGLANVRFLRSPGPDRLPDEVALVDHGLLSAVFEHLLPEERPRLLRQMWERLAPGGVLFLNQTPDRRFPIEPHTTGLPLLNYLPDGLARRAACRFSRRVERDASWEWLLRLGIRGGTPREILSILRAASAATEERPFLLRPRAIGIRRQSDIWYRCARGRLARRFGDARRVAVFAVIDCITGIGVPLAPYLSLAIRKGEAVGS
jgi:SAM-dependent methyltransferase